MEQQQSSLPISEDIVFKCGDIPAKERPAVESFDPSKVDPCKGRPSGGGDKEPKSPGQSDGNDQEAKTSGPSDGYGCDDIPGNNHDGEKDNENDHDSNPVLSMISKITAPFMLRLIIGKRCVQPLINHPSIPLLCSISGSESLINHNSVPLLRPGLREVPELISGSETGWVKNFVERCRANLISKPTPPKPVGVCTSTLSGQPLLEIFAVHTNLCKVNTIGVYDDRGGVLIYKYKNREKEQFIEKRNRWQSKNIGREPYDFMVKLVLIGPSRAMSAYADGWLIEVDVPPESSLLPETRATKKIAGGVFKMSLDLNDDFLDKPRTSIIFARGGFVHFTYVVFNNAVKGSVKFMLHARCQDNLQFVCHCKVQGELTLHVGSLPIGCTIFINQVEDDAVYFMPCESFRDNCLGLKLPLTRNVVALPIGSLVCVKGTLMVGSDMSMVVDQSFVLEGYTSQTQWQVDQSFDATICIVSSSLFMEW